MSADSVKYMRSWWHVRDISDYRGDVVREYTNTPAQKQLTISLLDWWSQDMITASRNIFVHDEKLYLEFAEHAASQKFMAGMLELGMTRCVCEYVLKKIIEAPALFINQRSDLDL